MAVNENIIKNMANEVTREAYALNVVVDPEFAIYLIELLLLNPKYGRLFSRTIKRVNLEYFVREVVAMLVRNDISINILKMQFIMLTQYDRLSSLIDRKEVAIETCLKSVLNDIVESAPEPDDEAELNKLMRKISLYLILFNGLGDPKMPQTLKEGLAALESVFNMEDLLRFINTNTADKFSKMRELAELVGGVRLFNRECRKGGDNIPDLPTILADSGNTSAEMLSSTMMSVAQRVYRLTSVVENLATVDDETGNICVVIAPGYTQADYDNLFSYLALYRQYEIFIRALIMDTETLVQNISKATKKASDSLKKLKNVVEHRTAVPVIKIYPRFVNAWECYREMQNLMFLVTTINRISMQLADIIDSIKDISEAQLEEMTPPISMDLPSRKSRAASAMIMRNFMAPAEKASKETHLHVLGFCALCLIVGALVPSTVRSGTIVVRGMRFGFCTEYMNYKFSVDPERYTNEILQYIRGKPHLIRLLKVYSDVEAVRDLTQLTVKRIPKVKVEHREQQTGHPIESYINPDYSWNVWHWKKEACIRATQVNCRTRAIQTLYSHHRAEIQCQTAELKDKKCQTKKDTGSNTLKTNYFIWGLRGYQGSHQHALDLSETHYQKKLQPAVFETCSWPCLPKKPGVDHQQQTAGSGEIEMPYKPSASTPEETIPEEVDTMRGAQSEVEITVSMPINDFALLDNDSFSLDSLDSEEII